MIKRYCLVYQCGLANVFRIEQDICPNCHDRPGFDGLGRTCKTCKGNGISPDGERRIRVRQSDFHTCEAYCSGLIEAGERVAICHCDEAGDISASKWTDGTGEIFAFSKHPPGQR